MWSACEHRPEIVKTVFKNEIINVSHSISTSVDTIYQGYITKRVFLSNRFNRLTRISKKHLLVRVCLCVFTG